MAGGTGIACFDAWAEELTATGWLHNHARMWFASIWIFTLRLPWQLGADLFLRHLLDGDPASNTLSWRWVAGLHTRGKTYLARADNIARYTEGRFAPKGLAQEAAPLTEAESHPLLRYAPPPAPRLPARYALVIHDDDCRPESLPLPHPPALLLGCEAAAARAHRVAPAVREFARAAVADGLARGAAHFGCAYEHADSAAELFALAARHGVPTLVAAPAPVGPTRDALAAASIPALPPRDYDQLLWPLASSGFFKLRAGAPLGLRALGMGL
jgi:deoxyribodipyrimidine photo-lyase